MCAKDENLSSSSQKGREVNQRNFTILQWKRFYKSEFQSSKFSLTSEIGETLFELRSNQHYTSTKTQNTLEKIICEAFVEANSCRHSHTHSSNRFPQTLVTYHGGSLRFANTVSTLASLNHQWSRSTHGAGAGIRDFAVRMGRVAFPVVKR